jgi:hypothetical protein
VRVGQDEGSPRAQPRVARAERRYDAGTGSHGQIVEAGSLQGQRAVRST